MKPNVLKMSYLMRRTRFGPDDRALFEKFDEESRGELLPGVAFRVNAWRTADDIFVSVWRRGDGAQIGFDTACPRRLSLLTLFVSMW